jgi:hypothetical protein
MSNFQVELGGQWQDYSKEENKILKRAFMAGFKTAKFHLRGQDYEYDFQKMTQRNKESGKVRNIRAPFKWKQPGKPIVTPGPTTVINVPPGGPGTTIQVPHPKDKSQFIAVNVPATAKVGQAMLVPVPDIAQGSKPAEVMEAGAEKKKGWSTGGKVAAGTAGVAVVGGLAVGGAILGAHAAEHGIDATGDMLGDAAEHAGEAIADIAEDAGEAIGDAAVDVGDFIVDAAEDVGDFVMDLF